MTVAESMALVEDSTAARAIEVHMDPSNRAPYVARQIVRSLITGGARLRSLDAAILASEAVSLHLGASGPIALLIEDRGRSVEIAVHSDDSRPIDDIVLALFERLASRWDADAGSTRFEIELISRRSLDQLSDEQLFALLPGDRDARDEIYERYEGFASSIAWRFKKRRDHEEDVVQVALGALVNAIDRFDPAYGVRFTTYAGQTISGTLKRYLRDYTWSVKVPRSLSDAAVHFNKVRGELTQRLGRHPTYAELAEATGATVEELRAALDAGRVAYKANSLDAPLSLDGDDGGLLAELGETDDSLDNAGLWESILPSIDRLPQTEQQVLQMRFFEEMTQDEIAKVIGVSQMQVSRLIAKAIKTLRGMVGIGSPDY